jgi:hypothetical protein
VNSSQLETLLAVPAQLGSSRRDTRIDFNDPTRAVERAVKRFRQSTFGRRLAVAAPDHPYQRPGRSTETIVVIR